MSSWLPSIFRAFFLTPSMVKPSFSYNLIAGEFEANASRSIVLTHSPLLLESFVWRVVDLYLIHDIADGHPCPIHPDVENLPFGAG